MSYIRECGTNLSAKQYLELMGSTSYTMYVFNRGRIIDKFKVDRSNYRNLILAVYRNGLFWGFFESLQTLTTDPKLAYVLDYGSSVEFDHPCPNELQFKLIDKATWNPPETPNHA